MLRLKTVVMISVLRHIDRQKTALFLRTTGVRLLLFDADPDGTTSAALLLKCSPDFKAIPRRGPVIEEEFLKELIAKNPALLVFLDMQTDQEREKIRRLQEAVPGARIIIIDHHQPEENLTGNQIIHINPLFYEDVYQPTAYLVYRLLEALEQDMKPHLWIAAIGVIADYAFKTCKDLLDEARQQYPALLEGEPRQSKLGVGGEMIGSLITVGGMDGAKKALELLRLADSFEQVAGARVLIDAKRAVDAEFEKVQKDFEQQKEEQGLFVFYEIQAAYNLTSKLSTMMSERWPQRIIIIRRKHEDLWKISGRCQSGRIHVGEMFKKASRGIGAGGGHKKAAGAQVSDWAEFKKRVMDAVQNALQ